MTSSSASADDLTVCEVLPLLGGQLGVERELGHAEDAVHRGADLVAHVGQELALGPAGCLGELGRLRELHVSLLDRVDRRVQRAVHPGDLVVAHDADPMAQVAGGDALEPGHGLGDRPGDAARYDRSQGDQPDEKGGDPEHDHSLLAADSRLLALHPPPHPDAGHDLIDQVRRRTVLAAHHLVGRLRIETPARVELGERLLVPPLHRLVLSQEAGEELVGLDVRHAALQDPPEDLDDLRLLEEGGAVLLALHRVMPAKEDVLPLLDLLLELELHDPRLVLLSDLPVDRLELPAHVVKPSREDEGDRDEPDAAQCDDAVEPPPDPEASHPSLLRSQAEGRVTTASRESRRESSRGREERSRAGRRPRRRPSADSLGPSPPALRLVASHEAP